MGVLFMGFIYHVGVNLYFQGIVTGVNLLRAFSLDETVQKKIHPFFSNTFHITGF